jgi:hypothetical protein
MPGGRAGVPACALVQIFAAAGEKRDIDAARWSGEAVRSLVTYSIPVEA